MRIRAFLRRHDFAIKGLGLIALMVGFAILATFLPVATLVEWLQVKVDELGLWAPVVFILLYVGLTTVLLPGWPLNVGSGIFFGPFWGGVLSSLGSTSAAAVSFLLGRYLARDWLSRKAKHHPRLHSVYHALGQEDGWKIVAAVRLSHSLPFGLQNFMLGVSPVRFFAYLVTTWLVTLPGIFMFAYLGYLAGTVASHEELQDQTGPWYWILRVGGFLVAGSAIYYLGRVVYRAIRTSHHKHPSLAPASHGSEASTTSGR